MRVRSVTQSGGNMANQEGGPKGSGSPPAARASRSSVVGCVLFFSFPLGFGELRSSMGITSFLLCWGGGALLLLLELQMAYS